MDLAGSEKVSKSECVGETFEEARRSQRCREDFGNPADEVLI